MPTESFYEILKKGELDKVQEKMRLNRQFRKEVIKNFNIADINAIETCILDKNRILRNEDKKTYREIEYETSFIFPDGNGGFILKKEGFFVGEGDYAIYDGGVLSDIRLIEYVYYNQTIKNIYHIKHLEFIKETIDNYDIAFMPLSLIELIYPAKMPTKDYFPFIEFDIDTEIQLPLTTEEKQHVNEETYLIKMSDEYWFYCIFWLDSQKMFIALEYKDYYFKQVGKNLHLFEIITPNT